MVYSSVLYLDGLCQSATLPYKNAWEYVAVTVRPVIAGAIVMQTGVPHRNLLISLSTIPNYKEAIMTTPSLRQRLASPNTRVAAKEELRRRILEIVGRRHSLTDMAIWQESAPDYLPWNPMLEEIKALDKEQKLRLETPAPGHLVVHSLSAPSAATDPAMAAECHPISTVRPGPAKHAKQSDEKPVTQAELADFIEQGYAHLQLREGHAYFLFHTGRQDEQGRNIFLANALGAAFVARHGLEQAWAMWETFAGSATILLTEDTQLPWGLLSQLSYDHTSAPDSLARILAKLRAGR